MTEAINLRLRKQLELHKSYLVMPFTFLVAAQGFWYDIKMKWNFASIATQGILKNIKDRSWGLTLFSINNA